MDLGFARLHTRVMPSSSLNNVYQTLNKVQKKLLSFVDGLNADKQMDLDRFGEPFVTAVEDVPTGKRIIFLRNGHYENMIVNTRRPDPIVSQSFDPSDGFVRPEFKKARAVPAPPEKPKDPRAERQTRTVDPKYLDAVKRMVK